jgi:hypothetical protein
MLWIIGHRMGCTGLTSPMLITALGEAMAVIKTMAAFAGTPGLADITGSTGRYLSGDRWGITDIACFTAIPGMAGRVVTFGMEATASSIPPTMDIREECPTGTVEVGDRQDATR